MIVKLIKKPDDPICPRISAGGDPKIGYYCVFRGDKDTIVTILETALAALKDGKTPVRAEDT